MNFPVTNVTENWNVLRNADVIPAERKWDRLRQMLIMILMTKDTVKHQKLEIMIKIAHQFLQALINYCKKNNLDGITAEEISDQKVVRFDMTLTESLGIPKRELYKIMQEGIFGIARILIDIMKETKVTKIPLDVLEDFEKKWNWKEIFKGISQNRES